MRTSKEVEQDFRNELQDLLNKYGAEFEAEDHYPGYPECGEDIRITVWIHAIYDSEGNCIREATEIDLGRWMKSQ